MNQLTCGVHSVSKHSLCDLWIARGGQKKTLTTTRLVRLQPRPHLGWWTPWSSGQHTEFNFFFLFLIHALFASRVNNWYLCLIIDWYLLWHEFRWSFIQVGLIWMILGILHKMSFIKKWIPKYASLTHHYLLKLIVYLRMHVNMIHCVIITFPKF